LIVHQIEQPNLFDEAIYRRYLARSGHRRLSQQEIEHEIPLARAFDTDAKIATLTLELE
jgi:hypothetical protein